MRSTNRPRVVDIATLVSGQRARLADYRLLGAAHAARPRAAPRTQRSRDLGIIRDGALLVRGGRIAAIGPRRRIERLRDARRAEKLDLGGRVVLPGFVDSHTHLIFPASRAAEYEQRISGKTYEEIARAGGGIRSTVKALRRASPKALKDARRAHLRQFAAHGTTTLEAKSGYGLDWKNELKILEILHDLHQEQPLDIVRTFLGAHVVPPEFRRRPDAFVDLLGEALDSQRSPRRASRSSAMFSATAARSRWRRRANSAGGPRVRPRAAHPRRAACPHRRRAPRHRTASSERRSSRKNRSRGDIRALALSNVVCTLLPGCCFHLGLARLCARRAS